MDGRVLIGAAAIAAIALVVGAAYVFQRRLIYFPSSGPPPDVSEVLPGGRDVTLTTADGLRLTAWYVEGDAGRPAVLVAPGNAGDRSARAPLARALHARGLSALLLEYRGYGGNPGSPTESGLALDARAAREFLVREAGVPPDRLVYVGESLGAAVVTELATAHPPARLVLRSPFTDLAAVGRRAYPFLPVRLLLRDRYPVAASAPRVRAPVTVVYGTADTLVPPAQSRTVAQACGARVVAVPGAGHNDPALLTGPRLLDAITAPG